MCFQVISMPLVRTLGLESRLDSRFQGPRKRCAVRLAGMAAGVGTARILGKLRGVPVWFQAFLDMKAAFKALLRPFLR